MEEKKLPDFLAKMKSEHGDSLKDFIINNPPKTFTPYYNENLGPPKKVLEQLEQDFKKKSTRDTTLYWIAVSSILLAVASLVVSIIALKN
jgi:hypothetical protein